MKGKEIPIPIPRKPDSVAKLLNLPETPPVSRRSLHIEGERFLGIFEPHIVGIHSEEVEETTIKAVFFKAVPHLVRDDTNTVVFGFEEGGKSVKHIRRLMRKTVGRKKGKGGLTPDEFLRRVDDKSSNTDYEIIYYKTFFALRNFAHTNLAPERVWGVAESPPIKPQRVYYDFDEKMKSALPHEEKAQACLQLMTSTVLRDIRFAAQLLKETRGSPNTLLLLLRGAAHLGFAPAIDVLSDGIYPGTDLTEEREVVVHNAHATYLPLLWQRALWEEIIRDTRITPQNALHRNFARKRVPVSRLLDRNCRATIEERMIEYENQRLEGKTFSLLTLNQEPL